MSSSDRTGRVGGSYLSMISAKTLNSWTVICCIEFSLSVPRPDNPYLHAMDWIMLRSWSQTALSDTGRGRFHAEVCSQEPRTKLVDSQFDRLLAICSSASGPYWHIVSINSQTFRARNLNFISSILNFYLFSLNRSLRHPKVNLNHQQTSHKHLFFS